MLTTMTLALLATSSCLALPPRTIYTYKSDHLNHEQTGVAGRAVSGGYGWTAPNGQKFTVNYIADNKGYRIVSSQNVFPQDGKPLDVVKSSPVALAAPKNLLPAVADPTVPALPNSPTFPSKSSSSFYSPQEKDTLARSHFGLSASGLDATQEPTTTTTTRRPITVIFFTTTPRPSASIVPVPSIVNRPVAVNKHFRAAPAEAEVAGNGAEESAAESIQGAEAGGAKTAKSVAVSEGEAAAAEGAEAEGADAAAAEGAEAEGADAAGGERAGENGAEEGNAEGGEAGGEGGEEGAEGGEGGEAGGAEEGAEAEEAEAEGEEGGEEEEEATEYGFEGEDEGEESGSNSAGEEW